MDECSDKIAVSHKSLYQSYATLHNELETKMKSDLGKIEYVLRNEIRARLRDAEKLEKLIISEEKEEKCTQILEVKVSKLESVTVLSNSEIEKIQQVFYFTSYF